MHYILEYIPSNKLHLLFRYDDPSNLDHKSYNPAVGIPSFTRLLYPLLLPPFKNSIRFIKVRIIEVHLYYFTHTITYSFKDNIGPGWYEFRCNININIINNYAFSFLHFTDIGLSKTIFDSRIKPDNEDRVTHNIFQIHEDYPILEYYKPCDNKIKETLCTKCYYYSNMNILPCAIHPTAEHRWRFECKDYDNSPKPRILPLEYHYI